MICGLWILGGTVIHARPPPLPLFPAITGFAQEDSRQEKKEIVSLNGLGYLHYHGLATPEDILRAYKYFMEAFGSDMEHPNADTLFYLGMVGLPGSRGRSSVAAGTRTHVFVLSGGLPVVTLPGPRTMPS